MDDAISEETSRRGEGELAPGDQSLNGELYAISSIVFISHPHDPSTSMALQRGSFASSIFFLAAFLPRSFPMKYPMITAPMAA